MVLEKFSMGIGDRFTKQAGAQLCAIKKAQNMGITIIPVWNKSHREHTTIGTLPQSARTQADLAVKQLNWNMPYHVDADHIGLGNVDLFIDSADFFTLDVADFIGKGAPQADIDAFCEKHADLAGQLVIDGIDQPLNITTQQIADIAAKYLFAIEQAAKIYQHIESKKGEGNFITEVSMDETDSPQTPVEMLFILAAIADHKIPAQTIAPKFIGSFFKGVDYVGDIAEFEKQFNHDLAIIDFAVENFDLPQNLKLSIHSGSDKFSIYTPVKKAIKKFDAGLHLKTAGTTWLEELIGLAQADGPALEIAKEIYSRSLDHFDELCAPYANVLDIDKQKLPTAEQVNAWTSEQYVNALRHDLSCPEYNSNFRQLLHVGYKIAAKMGDRYLNALDEYSDIVAKNVAENIFERHIKRIFVPD